MKNDSIVVEIDGTWRYCRRKTGVEEAVLQFVMGQGVRGRVMVICMTRHKIIRLP